MTSKTFGWREVQAQEGIKSKNSADLDALNISMSCDADHDEIEKLKAQIAMIDKELNERLGGGREVPDKEVHDKDVEEKHKKSH